MASLLDAGQASDKITLEDIIAECEAPKPAAEAEVPETTEPVAPPEEEKEPAVKGGGFSAWASRAQGVEKEKEESLRQQQDAAFGRIRDIITAREVGLAGVDNLNNLLPLYSRGEFTQDYNMLRPEQREEIGHGWDRLRKAIAARMDEILDVKEGPIISRLSEQAQELMSMLGADTAASDLDFIRAELTRIQKEAARLHPHSQKKMQAVLTAVGQALRACDFLSKINAL